MTVLWNDRVIMSIISNINRKCYQLSLPQRKSVPHRQPDPETKDQMTK